MGVYIMLRYTTVLYYTTIRYTCISISNFLGIGYIYIYRCDYSHIIYIVSV